MVRSIPQLERLKDEWDDLAAGFQTPLLDHDWMVSCAEAFHQTDELNVVTVRDGGGRLAAVGPLVREQRSGGRLTLLGASRLYEPGGVLFTSLASLNVLLERVVRTGRALSLQRIPAESPFLTAVQRLPRYRALTTTLGKTRSLAVVTRGSWDAYYAGLSSHVTDNLRRLRRKAERSLGAMRVREVPVRPSDVNGFLATVIAVEGSGWKGRQGSSLASRADLRDFFHRYCLRAAERDRLRVSTLSFGDHVAAVELSVEAYGRMWQLKIGYDDAVARFYPGLHLTEWSIRSCFERGLDAYEFLGSAASWEERWASCEHRYLTVVAYPIWTSSLMTACRDLTALAAKRVRVMLRNEAVP